MDRSLNIKLRAHAKELDKHAKSNFLFFLAGLLALLCVIPVIDLLSSGHTAQTLLLLFLSSTLVLASWTYRVKQRLFLAGIALAATTFVLSTAAVVTRSDTLSYLSLVANIAFWSLGTWIACRHVLSVGPVTINRVIGSICVYMMVAFIFALLNVLTNWLLPGSFSNLRATSLPEQLTEFVYYSFVTLNTLGYGDISPVGSFARTLAILEATFGVFYLAILVASLVGMQVSYGASAVQDRHQAMPETSDEDTTPISE
ncbi:MAG: potassium channel family protein [Hyphomicrobiales bacterium]